MKSDKEHRKDDLLDILQRGQRRRSPEIIEQEKTRREELGRMLRQVAQTSASPPNDQEIIAQCQSSDSETAQKAFTRVIRQHQSSLYTYFVQMLQDEQAAYDLTRDTFVQAYKCLAHVQRDTPVKTWLFKIAKQQMLKVSRQQEPWYLALLPLNVYQWYQHKIARDPEAQTPAQQAEKTACQDIRSLLTAYIDDELSVSEATRVETHLAVCTPCVAEYDRILKTDELVRASDLLPAPTALQHDIVTALETDPPREQWVRICDKLMRLARVPVPQLAIVAASIVIVVLGLAYYSQREQIRQMNAELQAARGLVMTQPENAPSTFVIFTGSLVSEEMPLEVGEYVPDIVSDPEQAEAWFIAGNIADTGDRIADYLRAIQGEITADQHSTRNNLIIRHISAELPEYAPAIVSLFFRRLEHQTAEVREPADLSKTSIDIYIISNHKD